MPARHIHEAWIPGQQLVAAEPGKCDFEAGLFGSLRDEPSVDAVDRGLVHRLDDGGKILVEFALVDAPHDVPRSIALRHMTGELRFVLHRAAELVETKGDRSDLALAGIPHQAEKRTGIDTRGEKHPDLDVRQQMGADTVERGGARPVHRQGPGLMHLLRGPRRGWRKAMARADPPYRSAGCARPARRECRGRA